MTQPRTMDGYVRVSRRLGRGGPGYISPRVQREAIERWAEYKDVTIAAWHVDEDETGGTQDRPGLVAAVERAVNGETGGIVSWRIDRFSRYTEGGLRDLRRLQERDARLAFVVEDIDTSGPMGRFVYTVMLAMGEYFLESIKAGWVTAKSRAIARGAHIGPTPFGYVRTGDGTLTVDPAAGPIVSQAFAVCARSGLPAAIDFLTERAPDRTWTTFTARRFFSQRVYLGQVAYGEQVRAGAHEALVTRAIFEAVRQQLGSSERVRRPKQDYPLSGVAVCGTCAAPLIGGRGGGDNRRMYRCSKHTTCKAPPATSAVPLERHVVAFLRDAFQHPGMRIGGESADVGPAETALLEAEQELDAFASDLSARRLLAELYHHHLQQRADAVDQAREQLHAIMTAAEDSAVVVPDELWDDLTLAELGDVLRSTLAGVVVNRGRGPLHARVVVLPKGMDGTPGASSQDPHEGSL